LDKPSGKAERERVASDQRSSAVASDFQSGACSSVLFGKVMSIIWYAQGKGGKTAKGLEMNISILSKYAYLRIKSKYNKL
jgi:hypothetical protein